jgi:hypothetical protein
VTATGSDDKSGREQGLGFLRTASIVYPLWLFPIVVIGGLIAVQYAPDSIESFYADDALPWLVTYWIGMGFTTTWRLMGESARAQGTPAGIVAAVGVLSALVLLSMLGGIRVLWEEPWIFGVAVAPGFALARPLVGRWLSGRRPQPAAASGPRPEPLDQGPP